MNLAKASSLNFSDVVYERSLFAGVGSACGQRLASLVLRRRANRGSSSTGSRRKNASPFGDSEAAERSNDRMSKQEVGCGRMAEQAQEGTEAGAGGRRHSSSSDTLRNASAVAGPPSAPPVEARAGEPSMAAQSGDSRLARFGTQAKAGVALFLAAIPIALTALLVWSVLGRPLLFKQSRAGLGKQTFTIHKFRTMHDTRDESGALLPDHLRETPTTRLLRRLRLDELLQLLCILRGEMSFIGPRPLLPSTIREFGELGRVRSSVRPGLTGWAQVSGNTLLTDSQKLSLDIWYIDHRSVALDALIIYQTILTMLRGERIYPDRLAAAERYLAARHGMPSPTCQA